MLMLIIALLIVAGIACYLAVENHRLNVENGELLFTRTVTVNGREWYPVQPPKRDVVDAQLLTPTFKQRYATPDWVGGELQPIDNVAPIFGDDCR